MYRFIFLFFIFNPPFTFSQHTCQCNDYDLRKKNKEPDSLIAQHLLGNASLVCQAKGFEILANLLTNDLQLDSAEVFLRKAEQGFKNAGCSDTILLNTYKIWAQVYYAQANFAQAQVYSLKMLHCAESAGNLYELAKGYTMIAQLFNQTNQAEKGIVYTQKAVKLLPKLDNNEQYSLFFFLCKRYLWHYQDTKIQSSLDSSELFSLEYLARARSRKENVSISNAFNSLQGVAYERGEFQKAISLLDSSFNYISKTNYDNHRLYFADKANIMIELKQYKTAQQLADSSLQYALRYYNPAFVADIYGLQQKIAIRMGDYKKAYDLSNLYYAITDSIRSVEKMEIVAELEKKYNQAKNETIIQDLDKKKQLYMLLALVGLFASLCIGFFFRQQRLKHKQDILETEQRLNRARMNPHFFFNALATLQKFALRDNDGQALASNLSKFSNIMRETLESTYKEYVTIEEEMDFLNEYLEVQKIRFPQTFSYQIIANPNMEIDDILIPSMILQPFVENSIEHGFSGIDYSGHVDIQFKVVEKEIQIEISDNGKGLMTTYKENNEHISRASQIIKDRIFLLNIKLKTKAGFSIDNNQNGMGALVKIHLPLIFKSTTLYENTHH